MATYIHEEVLFNEDYSRTTQEFSTKYLVRIFAGADPEEYTPEVFDEIAEEMVDQEMGYFQACCPLDFYDYVRSRSASYQTKDAVDWEAIDTEDDGLESLELYRRKVEREKKQ